MPSVITWVSSPVQPGETAIVTGGSFATNAIVRISRLGDGTPTTLVSKASDPVTIKWAETKPIHRTATSIYFVVPGDLTMGLYSVQVVDSNGTSNTAYINKAEPMWFQGTRGAGSTIAPGEELRVFGKSINLNDIRSAPPTIAGVEDDQVQLSEAMASLDTAPATPTTPTTPTSPRSEGHEELTQSTYMRMSRPKATPLEHEHDWTDAAAELSAHHEEVHEAEKCILHEQPEEPSYDIEFIKGDEKAASQDETNVAILRATSYLKLIPTSSSQGSARVISFSAVSSYDGRVTLPTSLPLGKWTVAVNNGYGGNSGWANCPDTLTVAAKPGAWPTKTFDAVALGGLANAINAANNNKGGIVVVPTGRFVISSQIKIEPRVLIKGAGMDRTSIVWEFKSNTPPDSIFQGSGFAIEQLNIYANGPFNNCFRGSRSTEPTRFSYVRFRANPFMKVYVGPQPVPDDANLKTKAVFNFVADDLTVNNCDIYAPNYAFYLDSGENVRIYNNVINFGGQGYSFICNRKMIFENNALYGCSFESVGNGISSLSLGQNLKRSENLYYANNRHEHNYGNNREMITLDGSGGAYYGFVASASGNAVTLAGNLNPQPGGMPSNVKATWTGAVMVILSGQGAGQYRRILSNEGRVIKLESAFAIQPNSSSRVQITFFRGNYLIIGNSFQDGGATQLYGCSFNCVVARNLFYRTGGFACWGLNPGNYGYQPTMYNEICDNQIVEGNAWATIASQFMTLGHGTNKDEPMARYLAWRRNTINNNGNFSITHATDDCLYEKNRIADTTTAFASSGNIFGPSVIFRGNITSNVKNLHQGTGSGIFKFL